MLLFVSSKIRFLFKNTVRLLLSMVKFSVFNKSTLSSWLCKLKSNTLFEKVKFININESFIFKKL